MSNDLPLLLDRISEFLDGHPGPPSGPLLAEMEHTLTSGYARALALEGERRRLERQMRELAKAAGDGIDVARLSELATELERADGELVSLRAVLDRLRDRTAAVRRLAS